MSDVTSRMLTTRGSQRPTAQEMFHKIKEELPLFTDSALEDEVEPSAFISTVFRQRRMQQSTACYSLFLEVINSS